MATILGTPAGETLNGTAGNDTVIGKGGKDTALMGSGEDVFVWNPGDGSDVVEGGADTDTLRFTGSSASENFDISANGGRALFFRNVANVAMDLDDVERIEIRALSGADTVTVNDLSGTDVTEVAMDLAAAAGGKSADANSDGVVVNGSNGDDIIVAATVGSKILVTGLAAQVSIDHAGKTDMLILNALGGDDVIDATGLVLGQMALEVFGGLGDDVILGSEGDDKVIGGDGDDVALLGAGNDLFIWNPGDDNDVVEGQAGTDTLRFNGANVSENIDIFANGGRVVFFRNIANVVMDTNDVERIEFQALGGTDNIVVNDLSGTDVTQVAIDLAAVAGGTVADTSIDSVTVQGTNGDDTIKITSVGSKIMTSGLSAQVIVDHADKTDLLTVNGLGGADTVNASGLVAGKIALQINGGLGNDLLIGSAGNDTVNGGDGDDLVLLGAGNDRFVWNPGDDNDTIEGQAGTDTLEFHGNGAAENIDISANGGRALFFRNVANVVMDLNDVERIEFQAQGGADTIVVNDLTGTDVKQVAIDLAAVGGGGDAQPDTVFVNGSNGNSTINVALLGGAVSVTGLPAQITIANAEAANDRLIINGLGGNDKINASTLPASALQLTVDGGAGNDIITGGLGSDVLQGGDGNDTVTGDDGADLALLGAGNDLFVWNPGDGNDVVEGQAGTDTLRFTGSGASENIDVAANGGRARLFRDVAAVFMDLDDVERLEVRALGGFDNIVVNDLTGTDVTQVAIDLAAVAGGVAPDVKIDSVTVQGTNGDDVVKITSVGSKIVTSGLSAQVIVDHADKTDLLTVNGLGGNDTINASGLAAGKIALQINGGLGNDLLIGSAGNDTVNGGDGDELALLGAGNDRFVWNPGDDNDTIEGQAGTDTLHFNGANVSENIDISANGGRALFFRNVANIVMDLNDVERIEFQALGGADAINVNDLSGTDVKLVAIDLAGVAGGVAGDGAADSVFVNGSNGNNAINVAMSGPAVSVTGLSAQVTIANAEAANDTLVVSGLGGNDTINASKLPASIIALTIDGGAGNDIITGGLGSDVLLGGDGNDTVTGDDGADLALLGAGNDLFIWNPGDGSDVIEGQADFDTLRFVGSNADESITIFPNGARAVLFRNIEPVALDLDDIERLEVRTLGGADTISVNDLTGTDVTQVAIDLAATVGGAAADTKIDTVIVNGTLNGDSVAIASIGSKIVMTGLQAQVSVDHAGSKDVLMINGGSGNDTINASGLMTGKIALQIFGGLGNDLLIGSAGNDTVNGGDGDDLALLGAGNDRFVWNPGDDNDTIEGQAGTDTLHFNGANVSENIDISANGGRALFFRNIANIVMDLNDVERIEFQALGGADAINVNDLSGTDVKLVAIDLAGVAGGVAGDGAADSVFVNGSNGNNTINVALVGGAVSVTGLAAQVTIAHAEAIDTLIVNGLGGNDSINAASLPASGLQVVLDGGAGNDTLTGNLGSNILFGGDGNDILRGGGGIDTLFGGNGNDNLDGGAGNDTLYGGGGNDTILASLGNDTVLYSSVLDGHDVVVGFDGNAVAGQDVLDLDTLFDSLGVAAVDRAGRVLITDSGASVEIAVDLDGNIGNGFELAVATLKTADVVSIGPDVLLGS